MSPGDRVRYTGPDPARQGRVAAVAPDDMKPYSDEWVWVRFAGDRGSYFHLQVVHFQRVPAIEAATQ